MNLPSSAFGLLLGFLALTMFAVSSTSRSTTVKPAASHADRAAVRRQAAMSRLSALAAPAETIRTADLLSDNLCSPDWADTVATSSVTVLDGQQSLQLLCGSAATQLRPARVETVRVDYPLMAAADDDERTGYDAVYDLVVLGISDSKAPAAIALELMETRELSAADVARVFQSVLREKTLGSRNATRKSQPRASLEVRRSFADNLAETL